MEKYSWKVSARAAVEDHPQWKMTSASACAQSWEVPTKGLSMPAEIKHRHSSLCFSCKKGHGISLWELCIVASQFFAVFILSGFIFPH